MAEEVSGQRRYLGHEHDDLSVAGASIDALKLAGQASLHPSPSIAAVVQQSLGSRVVAWARVNGIAREPPSLNHNIGSASSFLCADMSCQGLIRVRMSILPVYNLFIDTG